MKKLLLLFVVFLGLGIANSQTKKAKDPNVGFGKWLFVKSDKPVQVRYKQVKVENNTGYYQLQFRINFEDEVYCNKSQCLGYLMNFSYPQGDLSKQTYRNYKFMNSFKGIYTLPDLISFPMSFSDGSKFIFQDGQLFAVNSPGGSPQQAYVTTACVDNILSNYSQHNCRDFDAASAIELK